MLTHDEAKGGEEGLPEALAELLVVANGRAGDVPVEVQEEGEILKLLTHDEAKGGEHGHAAVRELGLAPAAHVLDGGGLVEAQGVEEVLVEGGGDARQGLDEVGRASRLAHGLRGARSGGLAARQQGPEG